MNIQIECPLRGYAITKEISRGANGIVYEAFHPVYGRVALKQIQHDKLGLHEIEMMLRVMQACNDEPRHVCRIFDAEPNDLDLWIAMEYFDLCLEVFNPALVSPFALIRVGMDSAKGILEMHRAGIINDDIKPDNMGITADGRLAHYDLGCARLRNGPSLGYTKDFAAPELLKDKTSDRTDIFSWGKSMEYLASGQTDVNPKRSLSDVVPWIGNQFSELVRDSCQKSPRKRPSQEELVQRMREIRNAHGRCRHCPGEYVIFGDGFCPQCGN